MNIIPHREGNIQVGIPVQTADSDTLQSLWSVKDVGLSPIQREALALFDAGLNVFPQPIGAKGGYAWKRLQHTRLVRNDHRYGLRRLFVGSCNIAVMCGATSGNLFVIDCESNESLIHHLEQMQERQIPLWAVKTARGGHIYLRCEDGEVHNIGPNLIPDAEIKGRQGYVLGPQSIHPNGDAYQWIMQEGDKPPLVRSKQIDWLTDDWGIGVSLTVTANSNNYKPGMWARAPQTQFDKLSRSTQEYLQKGHHAEEGARNNQLFKAACDLKGCNYSYNEARNLLTPIARGSGLYSGEINRTITSAYSKPRTPSRPQRLMPKEQPNEDWYHALLYAMEHAWSGRSASSQRTCFLALIERCRVAANENGVFRASIREIAELARLGTATVQKRLKEFISNGILSKCGQDQQSGASLWHFGAELLQYGKSAAMKTDTVALSPHWLSYSVSVFNSDSVERGSVGHSVMFIYQYLKTCDEPLMPSELANGLGISVNQANYAIRKLRKFRLVVRDYDGWVAYSLSLEDLERHMEEFADTQGKGAARKARFEQERALYAARLAFFGREAKEGKVFREACYAMLPTRVMLRYEREVLHILNDPLLVCALELGGVVRLSDGSLLQLE